MPWDERAGEFSSRPATPACAAPSFPAACSNVMFRGTTAKMRSAVEIAAFIARQPEMVRLLRIVDALSCRIAGSVPALSEIPSGTRCTIERRTAGCSTTSTWCFPIVPMPARRATRWRRSSLRAPACRGRKNEPAACTWYACPMSTPPTRAQAGPRQRRRSRRAGRTVPSNCSPRTASMIWRA